MREACLKRSFISFLASARNFKSFASQQPSVSDAWALVFPAWDGGNLLLFFCDAATQNTPVQYKNNAPSINAVFTFIASPWSLRLKFRYRAFQNGLPESNVVSSI